MQKVKKKLTAIDLFCGAGGLTLGLKRAGFKVVAGVELYPEIAKTYSVNHPEVHLVVKDVREVTGKELLSIAGTEKIDLLAGCPPCQGFSKLTDKYHRHDPRNDLVMEMLRLIDEIRPQMVMMENVAGITTRGRHVLEQFIQNLKKKGYLINWGVLQLADYGIPQSRKRFVLLAGLGFEIPLPTPTHSRIPNEPNKKPWLTLKETIGESGEALTITQAKQNGGPHNVNWHVVRDLTPLSLRRLQSIAPGQGRYGLPMNLRPPCHRHRGKGFSNVYGRMSWDQTPPTITTGFATPCKGKFGHPEELRTISVREAAWIQTFPKNYKFATDSLDTATELIGNALPPMFAEMIAITLTGKRI